MIVCDVPHAYIHVTHAHSCDVCVDVYVDVYVDVHACMLVHARYVAIAVVVVVVVDFDVI